MTIGGKQLLTAHDLSRPLDPKNKEQGQAHRLVVASGVFRRKLGRWGRLNEFCNCEPRRRHSVEVFGQRVMMTKDVTPFFSYVTEAEPGSLDAP